MVLKFAEMMRRNRKGEAGFTLIELLVVIAILGVLAAIAIPLVANRIDEARTSADLANIRLLQGAVDLFRLDTSVYPTNFQGDLLLDKASATSYSGYEGPYIQEEVQPPHGSFEAYTLESGKVIGTSNKQEE